MVRGRAAPQVSWPAAYGLNPRILSIPETATRKLPKSLPGCAAAQGAATRQSVNGVRAAGLSQAVKRATITPANSTNWGWDACCR
jgi:hypothetical protein